MLAIAPTDQAAEAVVRRGAEWTTGSYAKGAFADGQDPVSRYVDDVIVWGCPERLANELIRFREEKQLGYLLCSPAERPVVYAVQRSGATTSPVNARSLPNVFFQAVGASLMTSLQNRNASRRQTIQVAQKRQSDRPCRVHSSTRC